MIRKHKYSIVMTIVAISLLSWFIIYMNGEREKVIGAGRRTEFQRLGD